MRNRIVVIPFSLWIALSAGEVFGQDPDPEQAARARAAQEAQQRAQELRNNAEAIRQRELSTKALNDFLTDDGRSRIAAAVNAADARRTREREIQFARFRTAFAAFEAAKEELVGALGFKAKLKDPGRKMAKSTVVFLDFIKRMNKAPLRFDPSEFTDFTPTELGWEALTTAERVSPHLVAVIQTENEATVDIRFLTSLSKLQAELLRLQWMTQRLK